MDVGHWLAHLNLLVMGVGGATRSLELIDGMLWIIACHLVKAHYYVPTRVHDRVDSQLRRSLYSDSRSTPVGNQLFPFQAEAPPPLNRSQRTCIVDSQ